MQVWPADFPELPYFQYPLEVSPIESGIILPVYSDEDCDLKGGKMYYKLDGGDATEYDTISSLVKCQYNADSYDWVGYYLDEIPGALDDSKDTDHSMEIWWTDAAGNESNHLTVDYTITVKDYRPGAVMEEFTLPNQDDEDVSLSDFTGNIVVIEGTTGWCPYCGDEADEFAVLAPAYRTAGDPVTFLGMMGEDGGGSPNVTPAILTSYRAAHDWDTADIDLLADPNFAFLGDYMPSTGVPFNVILDTTHTIRVMWNGYWANHMDDIVDQLLAELE